MNDAFLELHDLELCSMILFLLPLQFFCMLSLHYVFVYTLSLHHFVALASTQVPLNCRLSGNAVLV